MRVGRLGFLLIVLSLVMGYFCATTFYVGGSRGIDTVKLSGLVVSVALGIAGVTLVAAAMVRR